MSTKSALRAAGRRRRVPVSHEFRHQVGTLGRPTWRTTAPGGRTLFWTVRNANGTRRSRRAEATG
jgi:hypothetical protein